MATSSAAPGKPIAAKLIAIAASAVVAVSIDLTAPAEFEPGLLYLPTIMLTAWHFGAAAACSLSLLMASIRLLGATDLSRTVIGWTAFSWFCSYFVIAMLTVLLRRSIWRERRLARTDLLTGLANREALHERIDAELNRCRRQGFPLSLAYIDCDRFKQVNDQHGHVVGDRVLQVAAAAMKRGTRNYDLVARPGGDEFAVVLPETGSDEARAVTERVREMLAGLMRDNNCDVTFSMGVATFIDGPPSAKEAIQTADELMYAAKQEGKNGVRYQTIQAELPSDAH